MRDFLGDTVLLSFRRFGPQTRLNLNNTIFAAPSASGRLPIENATQAKAGLRPGL